MRLDDLVYDQKLELADAPRMEGKDLEEFKSDLEKLGREKALQKHFGDVEFATDDFFCSAGLPDRPAIPYKGGRESVEIAKRIENDAYDAFKGRCALLRSGDVDWFYHLNKGRDLFGTPIYDQRPAALFNAASRALYDDLIEANGKFGKDLSKSEWKGFLNKDAISGFCKNVAIDTASRLWSHGSANAGFQFRDEKERCLNAERTIPLRNAGREAFECAEWSDLNNETFQDAISSFELEEDESLSDSIESFGVCSEDFSDHDIWKFSSEFDDEDLEEEIRQGSSMRDAVADLASDALRGALHEIEPSLKYNCVARKINSLPFDEQEKLKNSFGGRGQEHAHFAICDAVSDASASEFTAKKAGEIALQVARKAGLDVRLANDGRLVASSADELSNGRKLGERA